MPQSQANSAPEVTLILEVDSSLDRVLSAADPLHEAVRRGILQGLVELLKTLGIPGVPAVKIIALNGNTLPADKVMRVSANGKLCRYPDELLRYVHSYVCGSYLDPEAKPQKILEWLKNLSDQSETANLDHERLVEFLSLACLEIIKRQPSVLLGLSQLQVYIASLSPLTDIDPGRWLPEPTWLFPILSKVLNLKISIADKQKVVNTLRQANEKSWEDACEDLIVVLRPDVVEIHLPREYLKQLTTVDTGNRVGQFPFLRDGLFVELGVFYPTFRFVLVDNFKANSFAFKINQLTTLPVIGLQLDTCLVNDTSERLRLLNNIQASATSNPATGQPGSIIEWSYKGELESKGLTTWDQMGYLILSFAVTLRKNSACFVHREVVQHQLERVNLVFPALIKAVQSKVSVEEMTRVLRDLVAEEISVHNMRRILEHLLDYDYSSTGVNLTAFIRTGLKRQISHKYARGTNTLVTYLLHSEIERLLEHQSATSSEPEGADQPEDQRDRILKAIQTEVAYLPPTAMVPNILTSLKVRPALREVLASEFPRISAVAYEEISADINVQPIARISPGQ
jgi:flagellar biosynthesis component FlhA